MAIQYSGPAVPGGEVSPGSGSTGFTSFAVPFVNSSGQLTATTNLQFLNPSGSSAMLWLNSTNAASASTNSGALMIGRTSGPVLVFDNQRIVAVTSAGSGGTLTLNSPGSGTVVTGGSLNVSGNLQVGSSNTANKLQLVSTLNISTAVGTSGGAAAPPANPTVYIKILAPDAAGTLTTLYLPAYNSTG